jgi:chemotaxis signal transduction protein
VIQGMISLRGRTLPVVATIGERLIVLIDAERAFADVFSSRPARRRRTSRAQPSS